MSPRSRQLVTYLVLPMIAAMVAIVVFELTALTLIREAEPGSSKFLGVQLPPRQIIPIERGPRVDPDEPFDDLVVRGVRITKGDLWGLMREDPSVGYVPMESSRFLNGWWRSNDLGARHDADIGHGRAAESGGRRLLIFGESFTQGSRLPQEDTWIYQMRAEYPELDAVNFGVDGYGMAQSFLRYRSVIARTHHDAVAFVFLPTANLWRDINTIRSLAEPWDSFAVLPRFLPIPGGIELIRSPYSDVANVFRANKDGLSYELRSHLQRYDRFYIHHLYVPSALSAYFVTGKLVAAYLGKRQIQRIRHQSFYQADSEAWRTVRGIFREADVQARSKGVRFAVVVMPTHDDVETAARYSDFVEHWGRMIENLRQEGVETIDLLTDLAQVSPALDYGYDGSHYGPIASSHIASAAGMKLSSWLQE
ncbi:MAG: hypothetical protein JSW21_00070 [Gammaproteobacteria bacterium]|nr:MAG: hypothetical protein JSW21_00070 [Gammaproteobacteria bacterium]